MYVARLEQRAYIKIAVLRSRNAKEAMEASESHGEQRPSVQNCREMGRPRTTVMM